MFFQTQSTRIRSLGEDASSAMAKDIRAGIAISTCPKIRHEGAYQTIGL
jgi:hypothetical protein